MSPFLTPQFWSKYNTLNVIVHIIPHYHAFLPLYFNSNRLFIQEARCYTRTYGYSKICRQPGGSSVFSAGLESFGEGAASGSETAEKEI